MEYALWLNPKKITMKQDNATAPMVAQKLLSTYGDGEEATKFNCLVFAPCRGNTITDVKDDVPWLHFIHQVRFAALSRSKRNRRVFGKN